MKPQGLQLGIYTLDRELGRGGMGAVYQAQSLEDGPAGPKGSVVAIKVFHSHLLEEERALDRFQREAEVGKRIRHAHVVRTYDVGRQEVEGEPVHYMVLEFIEGQTLEGLLQELGTVPDQLRLQIADQVLDALDAVHAHGIIHRDIKPQNIVITPDHRVLLMDLGVARIQAQGNTLTEAGEFVGSLAWAAPEQFQANPELLTPSLDLYALGVVLYELATGKNPFADMDLTALLRSKLQSQVPAPRSVRPELDRFWNEVILASTRVDPADRFASAALMRRVLAEGEEGEWWRERLAKIGRPAAERALSRLRLERETPLIGRALAMSTLVRAWEVAQRVGRVVLLGGVSGVGKSRLFYDFLERLNAETEPAIAAGKSVGEGGRSYQPFVEAFLDLLLPPAVDATQRRAALESKLGELLAETPGVVVPFVDFLLGGLQPGMEGAFSKDALLAACARILQGLGAKRPVLLAIEDLHLAGAESIELLRHLTRAIPGHPILLLGIYSQDELEDASPLHAFVTAPGSESVERQALLPLDDEQTEDLIRSVVRSERTARSLARPLFERSDGNAFLILEMLAHLKADGTLIEREGTLELGQRFDTLAVPSTVREMVVLKLSRLDDEQRETLEAAAVLGYEFDAPLLASVLGQNRIHLLKRLATLERRHRLLVGAGKSGFRFASHQIYEAVYSEINPGLRTEYHSLVADTLKEGAGSQAPNGATAYSLLRHLFHAERTLEAEPVLEPALLHIGSNLHASASAPFLELIAAAFDGAAAKKRLAIAMQLWTCYELLASRKDQLRILELAGTLAEHLGEPIARAKVHAYRAGTEWYGGDYVRAAAEAQAGLEQALAGESPRWVATCHHTLGAIAFRRGELERSAFEFREALRVREEIGDRRGEASTLQALALVLTEVGGEDDVIALLERSLVAWKEVGERRGEAAAHTNMGIQLLNVGRTQDALRHYEQAIAGHREAGALLSEAMALANKGRAHEVLGQIELARASWDRALNIFVDQENPSGELAVRTMMGGVLAQYGEPVEAKKHLVASIALATRTGAKARLASAHRELGSLLHVQGEREAGWVELEKALALENEVQSVKSRVATLSAMGEAALEEGNAARADLHLGEALEDARRSPGAMGSLVLCRLARARKALGQREQATALALEALARTEAETHVSPTFGPEIYFTIGQILGAERRTEFHDKARALAEERAGRIRDEATRRHFMTQSFVGTRLKALGEGTEPA